MGEVHEPLSWLMGALSPRFLPDDQIVGYTKNQEPIENMRIMRSVVCAGSAAVLMLSLGALGMRAQTRPVAARVTAKVDDTRTVQLKGNIHPLARPEFDRGAVADSQPMTRMLLLLQRSDAQER